MRIIAGQHRGLKLAELGAGDAAAHLRPTSDRLRETLFNILRNHAAPGAATRVLDLFAGTGALGLEALSRGAAHATFVDDGKLAQRLIRDNIGRARRDADTDLLTCQAAKLPPATAACDLIFLDPPYGQDLGRAALAAARNTGWIAPAALIAWEDSAAQAPPPGVTMLDQRRYGDSWITLLQAG